MGFYRVLSEDELMHHGILGMKWGKKNGPPYPLGASDHSASEKKAGWRKSLDGGGKEKNAFSAKATAHKVAAKVYEINEKTYAKSNKTLSSINKTEKNRQLKKAQEAQAAANARKAEKKQAKDVIKRLKGQKQILSESKSNELKAKRELIDAASNEAESNAKLEAEKAFKDRAFKEELEKKLYESFGDEISPDDKDMFEVEADWYARDILITNSSKYLQKTKESADKAAREYNGYVDACEGMANDLIKKIGDKKAEKYKGSINMKVAEESDIIKLRNSFRDIEDLIYGNGNIDTDLAYSFDEYSKKFNKNNR